MRLYHQNGEFHWTTNSSLWKKLYGRRVANTQGGCHLCPPGRGCNAWGKGHLGHHGNQKPRYKDHRNHWEDKRAFGFAGE